jgi:hypothetical protein
MIKGRGGEGKGKEGKGKEGKGKEGRKGSGGKGEMGWGEPPKTNPGYGPAIVWPFVLPTSLLYSIVDRTSGSVNSADT